MAEQGSQSRAAITLAVVSGILIVRCLWRVFTPGTEYALPPWPLVYLMVDILMMISLFIIRPMVPTATPDSPALVRHATALFIGGIVATVIMVLIRVSSDRGWWTGHL